ncbi:MAG: ABC transporter substrate-binding protein [Spirochaetes bacterium]|nr:ABC transporter substrate-binding protein [Spirochaetota bacterium]
MNKWEIQTSSCKEIPHWLLVLVLIVFSAATLSAQQTVSPLVPKEKVVVAYVPIMKFATLYVAAGRGLFDKYGLDVQIQSVKSGTEVIAFMTQGKVDVGGIAIVASTWNAWAKGMDLKIIAPGALEPIKGSPTKLLVRKDLVDSGKVKTVADLRGMKVAMAGGPGSGGEYLATKALERGKLSIRDVQIVPLSNTDMPAALESKSIDAGILGSPYADQAIGKGVAVPLAEDLTPGAMTVTFVASGKFLKERPEAAKRFVLALMEAARLMQGKEYLSPENIKAYLKFVNTTEDAIRTGEPVIYDPNMEIALESLKDVERVHRENRRTEYTQPIDLKAVTDTSLVEWARSVLGRK